MAIPTQYDESGRMLPFPAPASGLKIIPISQGSPLEMAGAPIGYVPATPPAEQLSAIRNYGSGPERLIRTLPDAGTLQVQENLPVANVARPTSGVPINLVPPEVGSLTQQQQLALLNYNIRRGAPHYQPPPSTGIPYDTITNISYNPTTGIPYNPTTGIQYDPTTGIPYNPSTGIQYDPSTGIPSTGIQYDPSTGIPYGSSETLYDIPEPEPSEGRVSDYVHVDERDTEFPDYIMQPQPNVPAQIAQEALETTLGLGALADLATGGEYSDALVGGIQDVTGLDPDYLNDLIVEGAEKLSPGITEKVTSGINTANEAIDKLMLEHGLDPYTSAIDYEGVGSSSLEVNQALINYISGTPEDFPMGSELMPGAAPALGILSGYTGPGIEMGTAADLGGYTGLGGGGGAISGIDSNIGAYGSETASTAAMMSEAPPAAGYTSGAASGAAAGGANLGTSLQNAGANYLFGLAGSRIGASVFGEGQGAQIGSSVGGFIGSYFGPMGTMVGSFLGAGAGSLFGPSDTVHDETVGGLIRAGGDAYGGNEGEFATSAFSTLGGNRFTEGAVGIADNTAKKLNILLATIDGKLFPVADEGAGEDYKDGGFTPPHWNPGATEISVKQGKRVNLYGSTSVVHETGGVYQPSWNLPEQAMDQIGVHTLKQAAFHGFLDAPQQYIDVINNYSEETSGEPETLSNLYRTLLSASDADTLPGAIARSSTRLLEYSYADYKTNTPKEFLTQSVNTGRYGVFENGVNLTRMSYRDYLAAKKYDPNAPYEWKPIYEDKQVRNPDYVAEGKDFKDFASTMIKNPLQNQLEYEEYINQPEAELLNITNRFTGYTDPKGVYQPDVTEAEYLTNLNWGDERGNWGPATTVTQIANPTYIEPGLSREEFNAMRNTQRNVNPQHIATIDNYVDQLLTTGTVV